MQCESKYVSYRTYCIINLAQFSAIIKSKRVLCNQVNTEEIRSTCKKSIWGNNGEFTAVYSAVQSDTNIEKIEPKVAHNSKQITLDNRPGRLLHN